MKTDCLYPHPANATARGKTPQRSVFFIRKGLTLLLAVFSLTFSLLATAEKADRDQPINFSADKSEAINYDTKVATLSGNVIITQGTMMLRADRVTFRQNPDNTLMATATGKPVSFRQKRDNVDEFVEGFALKVTFDGQKNLLELFDQALLKRDSDEIRSNYISYNTETEVFRAQGRPDSSGRPLAESGQPEGRVTGTFRIPEENQPGKPPAHLNSDNTLSQPKGSR